MKIRYFIYFFLLLALFLILIEVSDVRQVRHYEEVQSETVTYDVTAVEWHWENLAGYIERCYLRAKMYLTGQGRLCMRLGRRR